LNKVVKRLLRLAVIGVALYFAFKFHWAAGIVAAVIMLGYAFYHSRSNLYSYRGNIAYMRGDINQAFEWLDKAYKLKTSSAETKISYSFLLLKKQEPDQAEKVLNEIFEMPDSKDVIMQTKMNLALAYWMQGKKVAGYELLQDVFSQFKNTVSYGNLGCFKLLLGKYDEALAFNLEAYDYNEDDAAILDNLGQSYYFTGQYKKAEEIYQKLINGVKPPKFAEPYYYFALTLEHLGNLEEAAEQLNIAADKEISMISPITKAGLERETERIAQLKQLRDV
jgi:tetratricopeptide (TPR) repeat protein